MQITFTVEEVIAVTAASASKGMTDRPIIGIAALDKAQPGDLSFLGNAKYKSDVETTGASLVLVPLDFEGDPQPNQVFVLTENPSVALARLCARIEKLLWPAPAAGIHPTAWIAPDVAIPPTATIGPLCVVEAGARIGNRVHLQAQVFVGRGAVVGDDSWVMPGCVIAAECILGERVRLQPGVIVGSDGFGYEFVEHRHEKVPQIGPVVIGNDVEIGANSTVDRARFSQTLIGEGTKIDNLVQIAHNVVIGRHCLICAQVGISGSTTIEDFVIIGGQAGLAGHLTVGRGTKIDGQSGINGDLPAGSFVKGSPCLPFQLEQRINVLRRKLPDLFKRVGKLETQIGPGGSEKSSA